MNNKKFLGKKWKQLSDEEKEMLLNSSNTDNDNIDKKTGDCIVDLTENLSVTGKIEGLGTECEELIIDDDSIIYNPGEGIIVENPIWSQFLSLSDASKIYNREESVIRRAINNRTFVEHVDCEKFGKQWVILKSALDRVYVKERFNLKK